MARVGLVTTLGVLLTIVAACQRDHARPAPEPTPTPAPTQARARLCPPGIGAFNFGPSLLHLASADCPLEAILFSAGIGRCSGPRCALPCRVEAGAHRYELTYSATGLPTRMRHLETTGKRGSTLAEQVEWSWEGSELTLVREGTGADGPAEERHVRHGEGWREVDVPGGSLRLELDPTGRIVRQHVRDATGTDSSRKTNVVEGDRIVESRYDTGRADRFSYDAEGRLLAVDYATRIRAEYAYDGQGLLREERWLDRDAPSSTYRYAHDGDGRLVEIREQIPRGKIDRTWRLTYDDCPEPRLH